MWTLKDVCRTCSYIATPHAAIDARCMDLQAEQQNMLSQFWIVIYEHGGVKNAQIVKTDQNQHSAAQNNARPETPHVKFYAVSGVSDWASEWGSENECVNEKVGERVILFAGARRRDRPASLRRNKGATEELQKRKVKQQQVKQRPRLSIHKELRRSITI